MAHEVPDSVKLEIRNRSESDRKENDSRYAIKLVERIVFALCAMVLVAVATFIISLAIKQ